MTERLSDEEIDTVWDLYPRMVANERLCDQAKEANRLREDNKRLREGINNILTRAPDLSMGEVAYRLEKILEGK